MNEKYTCMRYFNSLLPNKGGGGFEWSITCMPPIDFSNPWSHYSRCSNFIIDRSFIQSSWLLQSSHAIRQFYLFIYLFQNELYHRNVNSAWNGSQPMEGRHVAICKRMVVEMRALHSSRERLHRWSSPLNYHSHLFEALQNAFNIIDLSVTSPKEGRSRGFHPALRNNSIKDYTTCCI